MSALGCMAPLPSSMGLERTPFRKDITSLWPSPDFVALMSMGETAPLFPIGVLHW